VGEPPWGAEPRFELGPALQVQQAGALPTEPRRTQTEPRRTLTEPRRTLLSHAAPFKILLSIL
jgi:hypothetical protein